ncbi:MAG: AAA family ATPase [Pseudomonadota bacterium]
MKTSLTAVIVGAKQEEGELLRRQIGDVVEIVQSEIDPETGFDFIRRHTPTMALLFLDHDPDGILSASTKISQLNASAHIVVSRDHNPDKILLAMRSGAKDFAYLDDDNKDVRRAVLDLKAVLEAAPDPSDQGTVVAVFSCKGGSGSTTIATNLAGALLPEGKKLEEKRGKVVLLDLDFQMGDVLVFLDLASRYTWRNLIGNIHRLDEELLYQSLTVHPYGLYVVAQSDVLEDSEELVPKKVANAIAFLRKHFEYVVIDGLRDFSELSLMAMDLADTVLATMTQDIPALKNAMRCLNIFRELGYEERKVKLVLNRYLKRGDLDPDSIADALNKTVDGKVTNDFPTVVKAVNEGSLLVATAPKAQVTRDIRSLVTLVGGTEMPTKRGLFGRRR